MNKARNMLEHEEELSSRPRKNMVSIEGRKAAHQGKKHEEGKGG